MITEERLDEILASGLLREDEPFEAVLDLLSKRIRRLFYNQQYEEHEQTLSDMGLLVARYARPHATAKT
ncbi:MAG: hypothetical protein EOM66_03825, partial [Clostridia bacterium]|nr:hypothetical protein [Clostridia bacterium]